MNWMVISMKQSDDSLYAIYAGTSRNLPAYLDAIEYIMKTLEERRKEDLVVIGKKTRKLLLEETRNIRNSLVLFKVATKGGDTV